MKTLKQYHAQAQAEKWAMPHFNFSNLEQLQALVQAAGELNAPLVVGLSEGERDAVGLKQAVYLVQSFKEQGATIFLNADHSHSFETAKQATDAGFDSIHIDLSKQEYEKNKQETKQVVEYVKSKNSEIEIEGELGYLVTDSSKMYNEEIEIPEESYTQPEQALEYVKETGVDRFAPAVGNLHGIAKNAPQLRVELVEKIRAMVPAEIVLVLHGGSGISEDGFRSMIERGFSNIHINTELRVAYSNALRKALTEEPDQATPYKYAQPAKQALVEVAKARMQLFGAENKI